MKQPVSILLSCLCVFQFACSVRGIQNYSPVNAHSHNDYLNATPFNLAYRAGFGSIEADVFPVNGSLYVAHGKKDIQRERTLKEMYIKPLATVLAADSSRHLQLLVDIKENYLVTLPILIQELQPLKPWLNSAEMPNRLTILISGLRPPPEAYKNYPSFIFFDDDLKLPHSKQEWSRVGLVSLPFDKISSWDGKTPLPHHDKQLLQHKIDSVHAAGKYIRFWAAPDTDLAWKQQQKMHVDLIGTDRIEDLGNLLRRKN